jgi:hypothetical protein
LASSTVSVSESASKVVPVTVPVSMWALLSIPDYVQVLEPVPVCMVSFPERESIPISVWAMLFAPVSILNDQNCLSVPVTGPVSASSSWSFVLVSFGESAREQELTNKSVKCHSKRVFDLSYRRSFYSKPKNCQNRWIETSFKICNYKHCEFNPGQVITSLN